MRLAITISALVLSVITSAFAAEPLEIKNNDEFAKIVPAGATVEKLATDMGFTEGPVWFDQAIGGRGAGGYLLFSDISNNRINRWDDQQRLTVFREKSNGTNGNAKDAQGRLISCEHTMRRVIRTETDGSITVLADKFEGKRLNSPNDVVVKSDGTIWFTDPPYGTPKDQKRELDKNHVFRFDPKTSQLTSVTTDCDMPNGLAFSPDEKKLYIADSGKPKHIRVFTVNENGTLSGGDVFCTIDKGAPDGIRVDPAGRLFSSAADGVHIFSPTGELIGKILLPEGCANLAFGGKDHDELYMTARKSLYRIKITPASKP